MGKKIWLPIDGRHFGCDVSVRPSYVRTDSGGGESQGHSTGGRRMPCFLRVKSGGAFGQPAFFLGGKSRDHRRFKWKEKVQKNNQLSFWWKAKVQVC